jgi:hypothetical protein
MWRLLILKAHKTYFSYKYLETEMPEMIQSAHCETRWKQSAVLMVAETNSSEDHFRFLRRWIWGLSSEMWRRAVC